MSGADHGAAGTARWRLTARPRVAVVLAVMLLAGATGAAFADEQRVPFLWSKRVRGNYADVLTEVKSTLSRHNFPINAVHDYRETFTRRFAELGEGKLPFAEYRIVDFCNVQLAILSLSTDLRMGVFMPCRLAVYQVQGSDEIVLMTTNPRFMAQALNNPKLHGVTERLDALLAAVVEAVEF